jgi:hypothetical protein
VAAWTTAALTDVVGVEQAIDAIHAAGFEPVISAADGGDSSGGRLALAIGRWRSAGIRGWRYLPLAPADIPGLPGPGPFRVRAVDAGAALVSASGPPLGLVPDGVADPVAHHSRTLFPLSETATDGHGVAPTETVSELDRALLAELTDAIEVMQSHDLARWRDEAVDLLRQGNDDAHMPPTASPRAQRLAARSERVLALVQLASADEGGSRTAHEMTLRASALRQLGRVARAAHASAWNSALYAGPNSR